MKFYRKFDIKYLLNKAMIAALSGLLAFGLAGCGADKALLLVPEGETAAETVSETAAVASAGGDSVAAESSEQPQTIFVYVCGAVSEPGVVELPAGSRACDALDAAGGFAENADDRSVNLAAVLEDGQQLYFPTREEAEQLEESAAAEASGLVNINKADVTQLCTLPGIGESRAAAIVAYREEHGDFAAPEDIMQVSGIKTAAYEKICGLITVE